mgnify:CR=1 FL=1
MKKSLMTLGVLALFVLMAYGQEKKFALYSVAFYNMENLFDTIHDEGKNDYEYLPNGTNQWNTMKYKAKLKNMSEILSLLSTDKLPMGPAIIGVSEIENYRVLEDILKQPALADRGYQYVHYEGEDQRGVDCAFFYNPKLFELTNSKLVPYVYINDTIHKTRGFLIASGNIAGEKMHFIVNHWPSRAAASPARERAGEQVRAIKDSLLREDSAAKIVIMGDMNDDPMDNSMLTLGAKKYRKEVGKGDFFNPWWETLEDKGVGTLLYRGKWNLFDQIVLSSALLKKKGLKYDHNEVFIREYLFQQDGKYKGSPLRTHGGKLWLNGYSDHLPTIIYLKK